MPSLTNNKKYIAIIGDIINSRNIKERNLIQKIFKQTLENINIKYADDLAAEFSITLGDSFQGLLKNTNNILNIIFEIEQEMNKIEMRFGIGIGTVSTDIIFNKSSEIDGKVYHNARKAITDTKLQYKEKYSNIIINSGEENILTDQLLNSILSLLTTLKSKWTERQKEIIYAYLLNDQNQSKTANYLNISQPSVNKTLKITNYYTYKSAIDTINEYLSIKV